MNHLTNLVQFPGLGLSFHLNRVAFTIGGVSIYWYGVCIAVGLCLALGWPRRQLSPIDMRPFLHGQHLARRRFRTGGLRCGA